jgi:hypothetical protein
MTVAMSEITALRARIAELEAAIAAKDAALKPFAMLGVNLDGPIVWPDEATHAAVKAARAALALNAPAANQVPAAVTPTR